MSKNRAKTKQPSQTTRRAAQAGATIPQDHAIRDEATGGMRTITHRGHTWTMDPADVNDYRVIEAANGGNIVPLVNALIPDATVRAAIMDAIADDRGRVPLERMQDELDAITRLVGLGN